MSRAGARAPLRGELVFVDQPTEQVTAADAIEVDQVGNRWFVDRWHQGQGRSLLQRAVRPVLVVVQDIRREDVLEVAAAEDQQPVEAFAAGATDQRSACARAFGARTGALITRMPSGRKTSSKSRANLLSRSRIRNSGRTSSSSNCISRLRAYWVTQTPSGLVVIPANRMRRVANSMKNKT
jgi:hypothetical protein